MRLLEPKRDRYGTPIYPGDICVRSKNDKVELIIYEREVFGSKQGKGEFGRFSTADGRTTIKYTSVVFVCDPMGERQNKGEAIVQLTRKYYEGIK